MLRVLCEWVLARSAPASPLARACALHLLCRDAGVLHDAGMMVLARLGVCLVVMLATVRERVPLACLRRSALQHAHLRRPVRCI